MTKLDKYEILEEIGRGGFAVVYKARDTELDRVVALKVLHPQLTTNPRFIQRFRQEAQTAAGLRHPNIVTIHDVGEEAGQHYLVMAFLPGHTLDKLLTEGPLPVKQAISIVEQVAGALDAIHEQGLVHRDVKSANIIMNDTGQATLLDFGIVRAAEGTRLTTTMAVLGTPEYMAPEQAELEEAAGIDWRADIYALGVVAYELLVGRPPFTGRVTAVLHKHVYEPPPAPTALNPDLPEELEPVLLKALAKKREERYQSAGEMALDLRQAVEAQASAWQREERLAELYEKLQQAVADQDWVAAETRCREVLALEPEYQNVPELWMQVREARARQRELEKLYQQAQAKVESGAWAEVKDLCQRIESLEGPGYRDTDELLRQAEERLREEQTQKERQAQLAQLYEQARTALQRERWEEARQHCADIEALEGPGYRDVDELLRQAEAGLRQKQAGEEQQAHLAQLYEQLQEAIKDRDWTEVLALGGRIQAQDASYRDVPQLMAQARAALRRPQRGPIPGWAWSLGAAGILTLVLLLILAVTLGPQLWEAAFAPDEVPTLEPTSLPSEEPASEGPPLNASLGDTWTRPADGMVMVYVPGGEFEMGSTEGNSDEQPVHTVALDGFWIDQTEVTNAQYMLCVADGECEVYVNYAEYNEDDYPVVGVSWHDASTYCKWVGGRLPTEAEWEYAARGTRGYIYPWGNTFDGARLNFCDASCTYLWKATEYDDGYEKTAPVGSYPDGDSWCNALDMAGNVWEWVADWYGDYPDEAQTNPTGLETGGSKVLRGGSFYLDETYVRAAFRINYPQASVTTTSGFGVLVVRQDGESLNH